MSKSLAKVKSDIRKELLTDFLDKDYAHGYIDEFLNTEIATQIRVLREEQKLTQNELAVLAGMKQERISVLEDVYYDGWTIKILKKLAEALDVTLKVSFESFTDRIKDVLNLSRESLQRKPRELDLATYIDTSLFTEITIHWDAKSGEETGMEEFFNVHGHTAKESIPKTFFEHYIPNETLKIDKVEKFISLEIERSGADKTLEYKNAA